MLTPGRLRTLAVLVPLTAAAFAGGCAHRSVAQVSAQVPIGQEVRCVRLELENGTVGIAVGTDRMADYGGGARRAADTLEELQRLEAVPLLLEPVPDPARPDVLLLRGPHLPPGTMGLLSFEFGMRLPADLEVEIVIKGSGHVTIGGRQARVDVSTGRGDLRFEGCNGPVKAVTGRGTVIAFDHRGNLDVLTKVGDMQGFVREPGTLLRLVTGQGTVQCGVPEGTEFDVDARAEIGFVGADFGLTPQRVGSHGSALVGRRGAATTRVVLRTGSGHIAFKPK